MRLCELQVNYLMQSQKGCGFMRVIDKCSSSPLAFVRCVFLGPLVVAGLVCACTA